MKYYFSIFLFLCLVHLSYAQQVTFSFGLKSCVATGKDIKKAYGAGLGAQGGVGLNLLKNKRLSVGTSVFFTNFQNQYAEPAINSLFLFGAGLGVGYTFVPKERIRIMPFIRWYRASIQEDLRPAKGYYGDYFLLLKGKGSMWSSGVRFGYKAFFLEGAYAFFRPLCLPTDQIIDNVTNGYQVYQLINITPIRLNISTFQFGIGFFTDGIRGYSKKK